MESKTDKQTLAGVKKKAVTEKRFTENRSKRKMHNETKFLNRISKIH